MKVECTIEDAEVENESGRTIPGVTATCPRCDHQTQAYGTSDRSVKRCLMAMREECPNGEENFYVDEADA
jgi:hypothetical protein